MWKSTNPDLGNAVLSPADPVPAGAYGTWTITYTVGPLGIDSGGQIKIALRFVSDWGVPQLTDPAAPGYTSVTTDGPAKIMASWQRRGYIRPIAMALVLDIYDGSLYPGDTVTITLGDTSGGSPGIRAQTYQESHFEFFVLVDPTNATDPRPIADRLTLPVVAAEMVALVCLLPSQAQVGETVEIFVKGEDEWRNPTAPPAGLTYQWVGDAPATIRDNHLTVQAPGTGYLVVAADDFSCRSNPIEIYADRPDRQRFWGDLHAQTGQTVGVGDEDEYFTFGRDWARLDFMSHQGNDFQINDAYWQHLNETSARYHQDGAFVVFPGYEWSASSPTGGDHNVIYRREGYPIMRSSHWLIPDTPATDLSPAHPAPVFYERLKANVPLDEVLVCQHVGGRYANLREFFDRELISLVEVVSVWGVFEWMLWDAFDKGYIVGVMGNSDGHHGRPGAEGAGLTDFGIENGLTCVLASELSRAAIFSALKERRCYATTGARIWLDFMINGAAMGRQIGTDAELLAIEATVAGSGPLEALQLYRGREIVAEVRPPAFQELTRSNQLRISWRGSRERGRQRRVTWDGELHVVGANILGARTFSFDVVSDGIWAQTAQSIRFGSKTTGDRDGLDIELDDAAAGRIIFDSAAGRIELDLAELTDAQPRRTFDFGGVDMRLTIERYPAQVDCWQLKLATTVAAVPGAYFVKATQVDGQMAWASPIYVMD